MKRRFFLGLLQGAAAAGAVMALGLAPACALADVVEDDPAAPHGGNPSGDVLAVAFFDYDCPFCKRAEPELRRFVETDGAVRLVYKDWPVLNEASTLGARLALAAAYQGRYEAAHRALMELKGRRGSSAAMSEAIRAAAVDMARLDADAAEHAADITAQLARNAAHATSLGLRAVPAFIVGGRRVVGGFDLENFSQFAAQARASAR